MEEEGKKNECSTSPSNKDKEGKDTEMEVAKMEEKAPETKKEVCMRTSERSWNMDKWEKLEVKENGGYSWKV